jgi:hypothetical protein
MHLNALSLMGWLGRGRAGRTALSTSKAERAATWASCRYFNNDPDRLELEIKGLTTLSSARASVRADDGICARHDRLTSRCSWCRNHSGIATLA